MGTDEGALSARQREAVDCHNWKCGHHLTNSRGRRGSWNSNGETSGTVRLPPASKDALAVLGPVLKVGFLLPDAGGEPPPSAVS